MLDDYDVVAARPGSFVAESAGKIVGVLVLIAGSNRILLDNIAVQPSLQGTGLGKALLHQADDYARTQGYSSLTLYTHELMHENIAMYLRTGFIETHRIIENGFARVYLCKPLTRDAKKE
jgi:GNAT superfamily N-acetyltransferase